MKSSSDAFEGGASRSVRAWMPADFSRPEVSRLVSAQELLAILAPQKKSAEEIQQEERGRIIRADEDPQDRMRGWTPGEISSQPAQRSPAEALKGVRPLPETLFPAFTPRPPERRPERKPERQAEVTAPAAPVVDEAKLAEIMAEARARAEMLVQDAQARAAEILRQAQEETEKAVADGFARGRAEGLEAAAGESASSIQAAQAIIAETAAWREQVVAQSEEAVVEMIRRIARLMFGGGFQLDRNALQVYLNEVMETTRSLGELNIFLSPTDYSRLDTAWAEYYTQIRGIRVTVIGSNSILPGGCYVQGQMGTVDARVETKLAAVMETLESNAEPGGAE